MAELDPFERASLYVSIHAYLRWLAEGAEEPPIEVLEFFESLGVRLPAEIPEAVADYVRSFRAGVRRMDLSPAARSNLQNHLEAFYSAPGYVSTEPADSLLAMIAFAARLAIDAYTAHIKNEEGAEKLERLLHRFLNTHLIPTLKFFKPPEKEVADAMEQITQLVVEDTRYLASRLSRQTSL
jgi:hypothetical protein